MHDLNKEKELVLKINVEELSPTQVRLIKSMHALISHVLTADEEAEYFDCSAELMRKTAEVIKHATYPTQDKKMAYGDQAVEFAVDFLNETMDQKNLGNIDN